MQLDGSLGEVDPRGRHPEEEVDLAVHVEALVVNERGRRLIRADEDTLGEGRPFVGNVRLGADQADRPFPPLRSGAFGRFGTGQAGADDDQAVIAHPYLHRGRVESSLPITSPDHSPA